MSIEARAGFTYILRDQRNDPEDDIILHVTYVKGRRMSVIFEHDGEKAEEKFTRLKWRKLMEICTDHEDEVKIIIKETPK